MAVFSVDKIVALIPARGGSVGVPRKNLRLLGGVPLIAHTIRAALSSQSIDSVYVSSDDEEILALAIAEGALALPRPPEFSTSSSTALEVIRHFITTLNGEQGSDYLIVYLQPTSPFRTSEHIEEALSVLHRMNSRSLISVRRLDKSPFKAFIVDEAGCLQSLFDEEMSNANRQSLPPTFIPNGAIYAFYASDFIEIGRIPNNGSTPYVMDGAANIDIDTEADFARAEQIIARMKYGTI